MPVRMADTATESRVQIAREPRMPIGMSRWGRFASCAAVETASNPMYAKKTSPAPRSTPDQPKVPHSPVLGGMKGFQFDGLRCESPTAMITRTMVTLRSTITLLTPADSLIPITRMVDISATMKTAGRLISAPVRLSPVWTQPATALWTCPVVHQTGGGVGGVAPGGGGLPRPGGAPGGGGVGEVGGRGDAEGAEQTARGPGPAAPHGRGPGG